MASATFELQIAKFHLHMVVAQLHHTDPSQSYTGYTANHKSKCVASHCGTKQHTVLVKLSGCTDLRLKLQVQASGKTKDHATRSPEAYRAALDWW